jgi:hypothetical protein
VTGSGDASSTGTENLAYWPATGELWLANEQLGQRVVLHLPWSSVT